MGTPHALAEPSRMLSKKPTGSGARVGPAIPETMAWFARWTTGCSNISRAEGRQEGSELIIALTRATI